MKSLWSQFKTLVVIGWAIALIRLVLDATAPGVSMFIGVYYGMPLVLLYFAIKKTYAGVPWGRFALGMLLTGILVWGLPNVISYTAAQFLGWDHGRFGAGRGPAIAETSAGKVLTGLQIGGITSLVGAAWLIIWSTILIWLPGKFGGGAAVGAETVDEVSDEESPTPHTSNPL